MNIAIKVVTLLVFAMAVAAMIASGYDENWWRPSICFFAVAIFLKLSVIEGLLEKGGQTNLSEPP